MPTLEDSLHVLLKTQTRYHTIDTQSIHRLAIFQSWLTIAHERTYDLESKIIEKISLDIGCGQGDMIALFAAALKTHGNPSSKVIGVDPADLGYGIPPSLLIHQFSIFKLKAYH